MRVENIPYPRQVISVDSRTAPVVEPIATEVKANFESAPYVPALRPRRDTEVFALVEAPEPGAPALQPVAPAAQAPLPTVAVYAPTPAQRATAQAAQAHYAAETPIPEPTISIYV